jgi:adenosylcobinamide-phosphate synthase
VIGWVVLAALLLDAALGEPRRWHPLVGFGNLAQWLEQRLYADSRRAGTVAVALLLLPGLLLATAIATLPSPAIAEVLVLYLAIGAQSLRAHAEAVYAALGAGDLPSARQAVARLVSRDSAALDASGVAGATAESVLENGNDALFASIFWYALAGIPGVVLHRLANTLDAMWGYRNARYGRFGWAAARLDDGLNYLPARLTALSYAAAGDFCSGLRCAHRQGRHWKSPNAGPVMAAGAGSLGIRLGGPAWYDGRLQQRGVLGRGRAAQPQDIRRAQELVRRALILWLVALFGVAWIHESGLV